MPRVLARNILVRDPVTSVTTVLEAGTEVSDEIAETIDNEKVFADTAPPRKRTRTARTPKGGAPKGTPDEDEQDSAGDDPDEPADS